MVNLSLGTTATRAMAELLANGVVDGQSNNHTVGRATQALAIVRVIISHNSGLVYLNGIGDLLAEAVTGKRHDCDSEIDDWRKEVELANKVMVE